MDWVTESIGDVWEWKQSIDCYLHFHYYWIHWSFVFYSMFEFVLMLNEPFDEELYHWEFDHFFVTSYLRESIFKSRDIRVVLSTHAYDVWINYFVVRFDCLEWTRGGGTWVDILIVTFDRHADFDTSLKSTIPTTISCWDIDFTCTIIHAFVTTWCAFFDTSSKESLCASLTDLFIASYRILTHFTTFASNRT